MHLGISMTIKSVLAVMKKGWIWLFVSCGWCPVDTYLLRGPRMDLNILGLNFKFSNALPGKLYAVDTFSNFSTKKLVMCKVYTDVGHWV